MHKLIVLKQNYLGTIKDHIVDQDKTNISFFFLTLFVWTGMVVSCVLCNKNINLLKKNKK